MAEALVLALDLGTTTLSGRLLTIDGQLRAEATLFNPQVPFGADVLRRMEAAQAGQAARLQQVLIEGIEALLARLLEQSGASAQHIVRAAAAANPAIRTLLQGLAVDSLLYPPFRPAQMAGGYMALAALPVPLYLFPLVSGYVGGDLVAVLYAFADCAPGTFFIDVGTNGEMALFNGSQWWVTSVAAGPAFEGGHIACGMPAVAGAVTAVTVAADRFQFEVVGGGAPRGLCGSGLTEAIAAALRAGLIDTTGTLVDAELVATNLSRYLIQTAHGRALSLYRDARCHLQLTQDDIRQFQLAKGAVYAGAQCLLARAQINAEALDAVVMTGALGFSLRREILHEVAMLPEMMIDKVVFYDGGVLAGLSRYLLHPGQEGQVQDFADILRPYPLSGTPHFEQAFVAALNFPAVAATTI